MKVGSNFKADLSKESSSKHSSVSNKYPSFADVVIVGAGLAGLSCAIELLTRSPELKVVVLEARQVVGGRTSSWSEQGMHVDSGLHRFLGFYTALPEMLMKCGLKLEDVVVWEDEIEIRLPDGKPKAVFGASFLTRPLKTLFTALGNNHLLSPLDKITFLKFMVQGFIDYWARPDYLDSIDLKDYAIERGLTKQCFDRLIYSLTAGLYFIPPERYAAFAFFSQFYGFWTQLYRFRMGAFTGGMSEVMTEPLAQWIRNHGGLVITNAEVDELLTEPRSSGQSEGGEPKHEVVGVRLRGPTQGAVIKAEHIVLATHVAAAQKLIQPRFADVEWFKPMLKLPVMGGVTIQLDLTKPSMPVDHTTFSPDTCISSYSECSRTTFKECLGRFSALLTPPEKYLHSSPPEILKDVLRDVKRLELDFTGADVIDYRVISHPDAFYFLTAGTEPLRPTQRTPVPGLYLAGDYTRQRYSSTMEGATVSGKYAADAILSVMNPRGSFAWFYRFITHRILGWE
jgi:15-cis-phytoene desaturase